MFCSIKPPTIAARPLGIVRIDAGPEAIILQFVPIPPIDPSKIIQLVQSRKNARFAGPDRIRVEVQTPEVAARSAKVRELLFKLS